MRILLTSVALAAAFASAAFAGERTIKEIQQNDKVRVYEATYQPGDTSPMMTRSGMRVVYAIKGGTMERTYEDGKKETIHWKTGESRIASEERAFSSKNIGKGVVQLFVVVLK